MPLQAGTTLGPYEILSPIGAGGQGEVYKARDTRLDRTVAIKVLPEHVASDPDLKQRFEREAKTISSLNHPHICTLHDIGSQDGIDFLVMEYLEGETLAQRLEKGALPLDQALKVAIEIADALDKAHRQGITHRDLKPGNIMLTKAGAKLLDFGLAKLKAPEQAGGLSALPTQEAPLTEQGTILGTFQYMAPEQLEGKEGRRSNRHLRVRDDRLRDCHRQEGVQGTESGELDRRHHDRRPASDLRAGTDVAARARADREDLPGERPGRAVADGGGCRASGEMDHRRRLAAECGRDHAGGCSSSTWRLAATGSSNCCCRGTGCPHRPRGPGRRRDRARLHRARSRARC